MFGIQNYVQLNYSVKDDYSNPKRLLERCVQFIKQDDKNKHSLIIEGRSGGGKSLFLIEFLRHLNTLYANSEIGFMHVFYIKLREHSPGYVEANPMKASTLDEKI